jgi:SAM-dependent methyltransferase
MIHHSIAISENTNDFSDAEAVRSGQFLPQAPTVNHLDLFAGLKRRWVRERRRRKVGRAYDMALEISRFLPPDARVLDVGCGSGFIGHHVSAIAGANVTGIDLAAAAEAPIAYRQFDGERFPIRDNSMNAALFCYVLHHAQNLQIVLAELRRVLTTTGLAIVYEDIPATAWDRVVCWTHNLKWRFRTGPCTFRTPAEWFEVLTGAGYEVIYERQLSRWRNLTHPVSRRLFVLRKV